MTAPPRMQTSVDVDVHPQADPSEMPSTAIVSPPLPNTRPSPSNGRRSRWPTVGSSLTPAMNAHAPIGTLMRKSQCQLTAVTSQPPTVGPTAGAIIADIPHTDTARPWRSLGNMPSAIAMPIGIRAPPPSPWSTRNAINQPRFGANAHRADATVNTKTDPRKTSLRPNRSDSQPVAGCDAHTARR